MPSFEKLADLDSAAPHVCVM